MKKLIGGGLLALAVGAGSAIAPTAQADEPPPPPAPGVQIGCVDTPFGCLPGFLMAGQQSPLFHPIGQPPPPVPAP